MYYCALKKYDIADGPGVRVSLFVSGCTHHCLECFQPETWSFTYGDPYTDEVEEEILEALSPDYISGLTVLGGEPFEPSHQREVLMLIKKVKKRYPDKNIWCYSGYEYEELAGLKEGSGRAHTVLSEQILNEIDVLVDGEYVRELRNISLPFRGSENQRLINVKETKAAGKIILWNY